MDDVGGGHAGHQAHPQDRRPGRRLRPAPRRLRGGALAAVMAALVAAISVGEGCTLRTEMAGTRPAMTGKAAVCIGNLFVKDQSRISALILSVVVRTLPFDRARRPACSRAVTSAWPRPYW